MTEQTLQHKPSIPGKIDQNKAIDLRAKGLSYQAIADVFDCTKPAVWQLIHDKIPNNGDVQKYKDNKANILSMVGAEILSTLTMDDLKKESYHYRLRSYEIVDRIERLERGEATNIIETRSFHVHASASKLFKTV